MTPESRNKNLRGMDNWEKKREERKHEERLEKIKTEREKKIITMKGSEYVCCTQTEYA
jgi:hypothetical protein